MLIATLKLTFYAPWVHSLKEKRSITKKSIAYLRKKYNLSVAEVEDQDIHQRVVLGLAAVVNEMAQADSVLDHVLNDVQATFEMELIDVVREVL